MNLKFKFTEAVQYKPTLVESDVELLLKALDFFIEHHPKHNQAIDMASNIRNHWRQIK